VKGGGTGGNSLHIETDPLYRTVLRRGKASQKYPLQGGGEEKSRACIKKNSKSYIVGAWGSSADIGRQEEGKTEIIEKKKKKEGEKERAKFFGGGWPLVPFQEAVTNRRRKRGGNPRLP